MAELARCFIGGWGTTEEVWRGVLDRCSEADTDFVSWVDCIRDWPGALQKLAGIPGRFVLVGWSLGSVLALRAVIEDKQELRDKIASLVLVSATARMCGSASAGEGDGGIDPRVLAAMRVRMKRSPDAVLEDFAAQCAAPDGDKSARLSWLRQARQFSYPELAAGLDVLALLDVRERLGEIKVPCYILHGDGDCIVPLRSAQYVAETVAGAQIEVLSGRGHALPFTAAAEIARCVASVIE